MIEEPGGTFSAVFKILIYFIIAPLFSFLLDCFLVRRYVDRHKDLERLLLRQQLSIRHRHHPTTPRLSRWETLALAVLAAPFVHLGRGRKTKLAEVRRLFKSGTVLHWHHKLVRRQWTFAQSPVGGRSATEPELCALLRQLAKENPTGLGGVIHDDQREAA